MLAGTVLAAVGYAPESTALATFDGSRTTRTWRKLDDPVMGGQSVSTFGVSNNAGIFNGICAIVPFLHAPGAQRHASSRQRARHPAGPRTRPALAGFCNIQTTGMFDHYADVSSHLDGALHLSVRSSPVQKHWRCR